MLIVGKNDFHLAPLFQKGFYGQENFFLNIVKKTYAINDDEGFLEPIPQADQPEIAGPTIYEDDLGRSLMYPGDIDTHKPFVDVVINGCAFAPGGDRVTELGVSVDIAGRRKTLRVFGNRRWEKNEAGEVNFSDAEPFTEMPIRWEKAFGYLSNRRNPLGMGKEADHETDPENPAYSLPNIEKLISVRKLGQSASRLFLNHGNPGNLCLEQEAPTGLTLGRRCRRRISICGITMPPLKTSNSKN